MEQTESAIANVKIFEILPKRRPIVWAEMNDSVAYTLKRMQQYGITAMPVFDQKVKDHKRVVGWIDFRKLMLFLAWEKCHIVPSSPCTAVVDEKLEFGSAPISGLLPISSERDSPFVFNAERPVGDLISVFARGIHRALVSFEEGHDVYELVTQTDVIRWLLHLHCAFNNPALLQFVYHGIELTGVAAVNKEKMKVVQVHESALDGFRRASELDVTALAVVDASGKLVGTLSASDLRSLDLNNLKDIQLPVLEFLKKYSRKSLSPLTIQPAQKVQDAILCMLRNRVHRLWLVDDKFLPVGCVSMADILSKLSLLKKID